VEGFLRTNNLKRIVRGHTALKTGYNWWFDGKLLPYFLALIMQDLEIQVLLFFLKIVS